MIEITFLGRGGQGAFTSSRILGIAASLYGDKYSLSFPSFGPERRGAPVFAYTKIDDKVIRDRSQNEKSDYIVLLDSSLYKADLLKALKENGKLIINDIDKDEYSNKKIATFNATSVAKEYLGHPITNTAMLAALAANTGIVTKESILKAIEYDMSPKLAEKNLKLVEHIYGEIGGKENV